MEIYELLKKLRNDAKLTQTELGKMIGNGGYKKHHISAIENGNVQIGKKLFNDWHKACGVEPKTELVKIKTLKKVT